MGHVRVKGTPTHNTWHLMLQRCNNPNATDYESYGGRGITVCGEWHSYERFLADVGQRPAGMTLDRIDNNGHYEPGNCRWANWVQQNRNSRNTKLTLTDVEWLRANRYVITGKAMAAALGVSRAQVSRVLNGKRWIADPTTAAIAANLGGQ